MFGQKHKVDMLLPYVLPSYGGAKLATLSLARELHAQEMCDVRIWAFGKSAKSPGEEKSAKDLSVLREFAGVPILRYETVKIPKLKDLSPRMMMDLRNSDADILHFQGAPRAQSRLLLQKIVRNKIKILTTHGLQECAIIAAMGPRRSFINPVFWASLKDLDHIVALTQLDVSMLVSMGIERERITIIPNGLDETKFEKRGQFVDRNSKLKILCVARFASNKNYETLIRLVDMLSKRFDLEAYFIGDLADQEYFSRILRLIRELHLENSIKIGLSIDNAAIADCYFSCDLFAFLSRTETFGLVILEAMYAGMPILATKVGAIPEIVKDGVNGFLVSPDNIQEIYDYAVVLLENPHLRKEMGVRNKKVASNFTWTKVASKTNDLYKKLVEDHKE